MKNITKVSSQTSHSDERVNLVREIRRIARELGVVIPFYSTAAILLLHEGATVSELRKFFSFLCGELIKREAKS